VHQAADILFCKGNLVPVGQDRLAPFRARRAELAADLGYPRQVLRDGCARARELAAATLGEVRGAMGTRY
jgi:tryptophanyl-tRNA synthetase